MKLCENFDKSRTKRQINALIIYMIPNAKKLLMSISFPPFTGFCMTGGH